MRDILTDYRRARAKAHGTRPSRRLALALALTAWALAGRRYLVLRVLLLGLPEWLKLARGDYPK